MTRTSATHCDGVACGTATRLLPTPAVAAHPTPHAGTHPALLRRPGPVAGRRLFPTVGILALALMLSIAGARAVSVAEALFQQGARAYAEGTYPLAAEAFRESARLEPAAGTLQNLGNAEWQRGRAGHAVLAWEQALWLHPFNAPARNNLAFARRTAYLESPNLRWYEVVSTWLPMNAWAWIAGFSFWLSVGMGVLPGVFRWNKASWHQLVAALGLAVFLLSLPAHAGVNTRARLGFILEKDTPLRLTPTAEAQVVTRLAAGEPARLVRERGRYALVRTNRQLGWIERDTLGLLASKP